MSNPGQISIHAKRTVREALPSWLLLIGLGLICIVFYLLNPNIFSASSLKQVLVTASFYGLVALGLMFVMTTGTFDMSAGMKGGLAAAIVGAVCASGFTVGKLVLGIALGIAAALLVGLIHAVLNVTLKIPGFIAALGLRLLLQAVVAQLTQNKIFTTNDWTDGYKFLGRGEFLGLPIPVWIFFVANILCWFFYERTRTGRQIYATGANKTAAAQVGINTSRRVYLSFLIGAFLAAIAGILFTSRSFYTSVELGMNLQMPAMTIVLLGATFYEPGKYNVPGVFVAALFSSMLTTGVLSIFSAPWFKYLLEGLVFLLSLGMISKLKKGGLSKVTFDM